jgi:hypothetical protein
MIHWCKNKVMLVGGLAALFVAAFVALRLESRPVFLPLFREPCKVVSVEPVGGPKVLVGKGGRIKEWGRRQLDKLGFHLIGPRGEQLNFSLDPTDTSHAVAILCEGKFLKSPQLIKGLEEDMRRLIVECIDDENSVPLRPVACLPGSPGRVWLIWKYSETEIFKPFPTSSSSVPKSEFLPNYVILMPKVGPKEIVMLPITN